MTKLQATVLHFQAFGGMLLMSLAAMTSSVPTAILGAGMLLAAELRWVTHALITLAELTEKRDR